MQLNLTHDLDGSSLSGCHSLSVGSSAGVATSIFLGYFVDRESTVIENLVPSIKWQFSMV